MGQFVSRAGEKLDFALDAFNIKAKGLVCADFGSSTGGFVDCLLTRGARRVYSVDTAYGELAWKLRNDPRVVVVERTNAMHVALPEKVDLLTIDTGWTKQAKIIPSALANLKKGGQIVSLIKPHYEVGLAHVDINQAKSILAQVKEEIADSGGKVVETVNSPLLGARAQNPEFLALITP